MYIMGTMELTKAELEWIKLFKRLIRKEDISNIAQEMFTHEIINPEYYFYNARKNYQKDWNKMIIDLIPMSLRDEIKDHIYNDLIGPEKDTLLTEENCEWGQKFPHSWSDWIIHQL